MPGWVQIKGAAAYAGVSPRTLRYWFKQGLPHSRMSKGLVLIRYADLDADIEKHMLTEGDTDKRLDEIIESLR